MEDKKLLIVGIDPGTTTGYAVLDINGNLVDLNSSKQLDLNMLISRTVELGKVVLVGTDKAKVPSLVNSFATKFGARVINPQEDLKVDEKRNMTSNFNFGDEHQCDSLASALFAYKSAKSLLEKIDIFVKENQKNSIQDKIKEIVIKKKISIKSAVSIIEGKDEEDKIIEQTIFQKKASEEDFLRLYNGLKRYECELKLIRNYNNKLKKRMEILEKNQIGTKNLKNNNDKIIDFKENRIKFLSNLLKSKESEIEQLKFLFKRFNEKISNINKFYILKKLDTLSKNEFKFKNKILHIQQDDILIVYNPNIASNDVIDFLRNKVFIIINKKPISKETRDEMPFVFIDAKNVKIDEDRYFGFVEKKHFDIEKDKANWFKKIVDDYKKEKHLMIG